MHKDEGERSREKGSHFPETSKQIAFAMALCYVVGLVTTNVFLRRHGLSDFSLVRPKAILIGAIIVGSLSLISIYPARVVAQRFGLPLKSSPPTRASARKAVLVWICLAALLILIRNGPSVPFLRIFDKPSLFWIVIQNVVIASELYIFALAVKILGLQVIRYNRLAVIHLDVIDMAFAWTQLTIWITALFFALTIYISVFAQHIFILIPREYGGGKPDWTQFETNPNSVKEFISLGINVNGGITDPVAVIYESESTITIVFDKNAECETITFDKKLINASVWIEKPPRQPIKACLLQ